VDKYCFRAPYVSALLRHGLGVSNAHVRIGGGDVAWTLGDPSFRLPASQRMLHSMSVPACSQQSMSCLHSVIQAFSHIEIRPRCMSLRAASVQE